MSITRILCFGDSLTAGFASSRMTFTPYSTSLQTSLCEISGNQVEAISTGFSGFTTQDMIENSSRTVAAPISGEVLPGLEISCREKKFDMVIILAGTNDLGGLSGITTQENLNRGCSEILNNLKSLHGIAHEAGIFTVALGIPESRYVTRETMVNDCRKKINDQLKQWAEDENINSKFFDFPINYCDEEISSGHWEYDGLHLTSKGYLELGKRLAPLIKLY